ncbi:MAG: glycoside hydrolase [Chloroflexota bacterium]|nr:isoamylase early set domain-containing protein [Anaerolineales bacterium]RLD07467.1 MAG: glycoside hydrolase [Chloroflexota bacterium]HDD62260.1 glycoside hydrolase [Chloroflexota bacterium]
MLKKQYIKSRNVYKVTFRLAKHEQPEYSVSSAHLVADFNDWSFTNTPMESLKNGDFKITVELEAGKKHEFRYLLNNKKWYNEWEADEYILGDFGKDNCVIELPEN